MKALTLILLTAGFCAILFCTLIDNNLGAYISVGLIAVAIAILTHNEK